MLASPAFGLILDAIFIGGCILYYKGLQKKKKDLEGLKLQMQQLNDELVAYYNDYPGFCPVAFEYSHPASIAELMDLIRLRRADTIKEAMNVMIEDIHRANLEQSQQEILYQTQNASRAARSTAFWSAANFFKR